MKKKKKLMKDNKSFYGRKIFVFYLKCKTLLYTASKNYGNKQKRVKNQTRQPCSDIKI